jgi:hypothetical protein
VNEIECFKCAGTGVPAAYQPERDFTAEGVCSLCTGRGLIAEDTPWPSGAGYVWMKSLTHVAPPPKLDLSAYPPELLERYTKTIDPKTVGIFSISELKFADQRVLPPGEYSLDHTSRGVSIVPKNPDSRGSLVIPQPRLPHMVDPERVGGIPPGVGLR